VSEAKPAIYVLNGPNLNLLGVREPAIYGATTLGDVEALARRHADTHGFELVFRQSNHEGQLIDWIHEARGRAVGIVLNAGALTHTSIALMDALKGVGLPAIEVHLSNVFQRESFRHHSYPALAARAVIAGLGAHGYGLAIDALAVITRS
jgi:3-dehydroquinate dehydratase-2